jgi:hypothetical protein
MRHGCHGATHGFDPRTCGKSFTSSRVKVIVDARDCEEGSSKDEKKKDGPSIDPDLRETGPEAKIGCDGWCCVWCRSRWVLVGVIVSHLMAASRHGWRGGGGLI